MAEPRCDCCDLPVYSCGTEVARLAEVEHRARVERALAEPGTVSARHKTRCAGCGERVRVGEPIYRGEDGWTGALCCPRGQ